MTRISAMIAVIRRPDEATVRSPYLEFHVFSTPVPGTLSVLVHAGQIC